MKKIYKKVSWLVNGAFIGLIIGGLIGRSLDTIIIGVLLGLSTAVVIKLVVWFRSRTLS